MPHARQSTRQRFRDVVHQVVIRESSIPKPSREDDEVGEEVGGAESVAVDEDGAKNGRVRDAGEEG